MKTIIKKAMLISFVILMVMGFWSRFICFQDNSKNTIRILVDRLPYSLSSSQRLDISGRRIWPLIESGIYRLSYFDPLAEVRLEPATPKAFNRNRPTLKFVYIQDETTRALSFEKGEAEVVYTALNIEKTNWLQQKMPSTHFWSAPGSYLSFLGFNLRNESLSQLEVRRNLTQALTISKWAHEKWKDWVIPLNAFLLPTLDPKSSADYFKNHPIPELSYLTTPVREGYETAAMIREAFKNIGVSVQIQMVEPALFYARLKKGEDALFSTRIIRSSPKDPMQAYVKTGAEKNYFHYSNLELDHYLDLHPDAGFDEVKPWIERDLPFVPLYNWKHSLILNPRMHFKPNFNPTLDETFRFLLDLELE